MNFTEIFEASKTYVDLGLTTQAIRDQTPAQLAVSLDIQEDDLVQFLDRNELIKRKLIAYAEKRDNLDMIEQIRDKLTTTEWQWVVDNLEFLGDHTNNVKL